MNSNTKHFRRIVFAAAILFSLFSWIVRTSALAAEGDITISTPESVEKGGSFASAVQVNVGDALLGAYDIVFTYDKAALQIKEVSGGSTSEFSEAPTYGGIDTANTTGSIHVVSYQSSITSPKNLVGIFSILFSAIGNQGTSSTLSMTVNKLLDAQGDSISHQVIDAVVKISAAPALYVSSDGDCGIKTPCCESIQKAIDDAATGSEILVKQGTYAESLKLKNAKTLLIKGGYDSTYEQQTSNTTFIQASGQTSIQASIGSLKFQMISIKVSSQN